MFCMSGLQNAVLCFLLGPHLLIGRVSFYSLPWLVCSMQLQALVIQLTVIKRIAQGSF